MQLARVTGQVWGARQAARLEGRRLLRLAPLRRDPASDQLVEGDSELIAVDALGAGPGELVLYAHSSRVRDLTVGADVPGKGVVLAIVDDLAIGGAGGRS